MYCSACGFENQNDVAFCVSCGAKTGQSQQNFQNQDVQKMIELGFSEPVKQRRFFAIRHWVHNDIKDDNIYSIEQKVDNITLSEGSYLHIEARYGGSFILERGAALVAPNLEKCNSIILKTGAKAWVPNLLKTENGWFAGDDINRNGTVFVEKGALIYAPLARFKYCAGDGDFIR